MLLVLPVFLLGGCAQLASLPGPGLAFGVLGDTPSSPAQAAKLDALIARINAQDLAFVVHVGDIGTSGRDQGCSDAWVAARQRQFGAIRHPFVLLPGDNEWTDCARHGMDPLARLENWRRLFCGLGGGLALTRQPGQCENARWAAHGMHFIALNVPGGANPELGDARMAATLRWLDESLAQAEKELSARVFVFLHADPRFWRWSRVDAYARLRGVLGVHATRLGSRMVLVHGDTHVYRDDAPLPGLRRVVPWGSPFVSWLRVSVSAGAGEPAVEAGW